MNKKRIGAVAGASALSLLLLGAHSSSAAPLQGPDMGYDTWYQFGMTTTESEVLAQARLLVNDGLAASGYDTVALDDGWMSSSRTSSGALTWDPTKFPDGIPALSAKLHSMGLKFGIYEAIGNRTCENFPGSSGHYEQDAQTFASWGVNFVKVDDCGGPTSEAQAAMDFTQFGSDLRSADVGVTYDEELPIPYIGTSSFLPAIQTSAGIAQSWRVAFDESPLSTATSTILDHLSADLHLHGFAGPGHWNDLDMLVPGTVWAHPFNWPYSEEVDQLAIWSEEASPLFISDDLSSLSAQELAALKNPTMLSIDQSGSQPAEAFTLGHIEAVIKPADGGEAVLFVNLGTGTGSAKFTPASLGLGSTVNSANVWNGEVCSGCTGLAITLGAGQTSQYIMKTVS